MHFSLKFEPIENLVDSFSIKSWSTSNLNFERSVIIPILISNIARAWPGQDLIPNENGENEIESRDFDSPFGLLNKGLVGSNLSGINLWGSLHSSGL